MRGIDIGDIDGGILLALICSKELDLRIFKALI
jgi:hypothetical protein